MALFAPVVIGRSNYFVLVFRQLFENRSNRRIFADVIVYIFAH